MANQSLKEAFPNLFHLFPNQKSSVADSGCWCGVVWNWSVSIPSLLPSLELSRDLVDLESSMPEKTPIVGRINNFAWLSNALGDFYVSSCYELLSLDRQQCGFEGIVVLALKEMWRSIIPSNIQIFSWMFLLDKLAMKDQLLKRGVNFRGNNSVCVMWSCFVKITNHLFLKCICAVNI